MNSTDTHPDSGAHSSAGHTGSEGGVEGSPQHGLAKHRLEIKRFALGPFATNCYLVRASGHRGFWIIDASFSPRKMIDAAREWVAEGGKPELLILTHAHVDHIAGVDEVRAAFPGLPILIHANERHWLKDAQANLSGLHGMPVTCADADRTIGQGDILTLGQSRWEVLETPGHSPGSISLVCRNGEPPVVFAGDALFNGSVGRTDFPGSDPEILKRSIRTQLYALDPATVVLPGHGPQTTVGAEMRSNPYVRG